MPATPSGPIAGQEGGASSYQFNTPSGVWGDSGSGIGTLGTSDSFHGVHGQGGFVAVYGDGGSAGVVGYSSSGSGVRGLTDSGVALYGRADAGGLAGYMEGFARVTQILTVDGGIVTNNVSKVGSCNFKIDHPLDPENRYLYHASVESPDMKNIYDAVATLDPNGEAVVKLPAWFEPLNQDFRYQLTPIGAPAPNLHVAEGVAGNCFKIAGGSPGMKVSWQVTGIRHDPYASAHRSPVEVEKSESERGYYLHPELFGQPPEKGIEWAHHPVLMQRMNAEREGQDHPVHFPGPDDPSIGARAETSHL